MALFIVPMAFLSEKSFPNIWRVLGLSVAAGYISLGALDLAIPSKMTEMRSLLLDEHPDAEKIAATALTWISAREISVGVALLAFYYQEKPREMRPVILSGMIVYAADIIFAYRHRNDLYADFTNICGFLGVTLLETGAVGVFAWKGAA